MTEGFSETNLNLFNSTFLSNQDIQAFRSSCDSAWDSNLNLNRKENCRHLALFHFFSYVRVQAVKCYHAIDLYMALLFSLFSLNMEKSRFSIRRLAA